MSDEFLADHIEVFSMFPCSPQIPAECWKVNVRRIGSSKLVAAHVEPWHIGEMPVGGLSAVPQLCDLQHSDLIELTGLQPSFNQGHRYSHRLQRCFQEWEIAWTLGTFFGENYLLLICGCVFFPSCFSCFFAFLFIVVFLFLCFVASSFSLISQLLCCVFLVFSPLHCFSASLVVFCTAVLLLCFLLCYFSTFLSTTNNNNNHIAGKQQQQ